MYFYEFLAASSEARNVVSKLTEAIRDDRNSASNCDILQICIDRLAAVCRVRALSYDFIRDSDSNEDDDNDDSESPD